MKGMPPTHRYRHVTPDGTELWADTRAVLARRVAAYRLASQWDELSYGEQCAEAIKVMYELADKQCSCQKPHFGTPII